MFFSSDGLLPMKTYLRPPDVPVKSVASYSSTILATLRLVWLSLSPDHDGFCVPRSSLMSRVVCYSQWWLGRLRLVLASAGTGRCRSAWLAATGSCAFGWLRCSRMNWCTVCCSKCSIKSIFSEDLWLCMDFDGKNTHLKSIRTLLRSDSDKCFWLVECSVDLMSTSVSVPSVESPLQLISAQLYKPNHSCRASACLNVVTFWKLKSLWPGKILFTMSCYLKWNLLKQSGLV